MLEIACFSLTSALTAQEAGASRIEFCTSYPLGGVTPSPAAVQALQGLIHIPVYVMIRPPPPSDVEPMSAAAFVPTPAEFDRMKEDIRRLRTLDVVRGFVFGVLKADGGVDGVANETLVGLAGERPCTFHRAVDFARDFAGAVRVIGEVGFRGVLTSGGMGSVEERVGKISGMVEVLRERADGKEDRMVGWNKGVRVIVGGGIRSGNLRELREKFGVLGERFGWHSSAIIEGEDADGEEVRKLKAIVDEMDEEMLGTGKESDECWDKKYPELKNRVTVMRSMPS
ncbi:hypothetical protein M501DRAFT_215905 [Patellaria atrata CBS 101060]|uniref:Copper homeostasis protein cutC homolog n=1 Tax=Patellaria atrata CBS 101060 TaxID=1346257 RepID=A0A9P4S8L0_9PEZI|nr:hypothetical protein M501DRAFT_215905 [Patellaria atrata CBS 101060]